jgi:phage terminase small subunit
VRAISPRQKAFADAILAGKQPSEAYRASGYGCKSNNRVIAVRAQRVLKYPGVIEYMAAERKRLARAQILTRERSLQILANIAEAGSATKRDKIAAIAQSSRMQGYDAPQKVEMKVEGSLLFRIRNTPK